MAGGPLKLREYTMGFRTCTEMLEDDLGLEERLNRSREAYAQILAESLFEDISGKPRPAPPPPTRWQRFKRRLAGWLYGQAIKLDPDLVDDYW